MRPLMIYSSLALAALLLAGCVCNPDGGTPAGQPTYRAPGAGGARSGAATGQQASELRHEIRRRDEAYMSGLRQLKARLVRVQDRLKVGGTPQQQAHLRREQEQLQQQIRASMQQRQRSRQREQRRVRQRRTQRRPLKK